MLIIYIFLAFLPWPIRRFILTRILKHDIDKSAYIGLSIVNVKFIKMGPRSKIGHFNRISGLACLKMGEFSSISHLNWISGFNVNGTKHFILDENRSSKLVIGRHSAITNRHLIDCTDTVKIGEFTTFAGNRSQILTHGIDISESRQKSAPVEIGSYCFIGTGSIILKNAILPSYCVLAAGSVLSGKHDSEYQIFSGVPAKPVKRLDCTAKYFVRTSGFVE